MARSRTRKPPPLARPAPAGGDDAPSALDLIEEGVHLLRRMPLGAWTVYLLGTGAFVAGFLYFWHDMAHSGLAPRHLAEASFGLAALFVFMRAAQVWFLRAAWGVLRGEALPPWRAREAAEVLAGQAHWSAATVWVLPVCALITLPLSHAFALLQHQMALRARVVDAGDETGFNAAHRLAGIWPKQGWALVGLLSLLGFLLFLNWYSLLALAPGMLKTLFGLDTLWGRSGVSFLNTTTFSAALGLTYLSWDPLVKAAYLLRCHYAQSRQSGEDLLYALRRLRDPARALVIGMVAFAALGLSLPEARAGDSAPDPVTLDASIDDTLSQPEYIWRFPKKDIPAEWETPTWWGDFWSAIGDVFETLSDWLKGFFEREEKASEPRDSTPWLSGLDFGDIALYTILIVAAVGLAWGIVKIWSTRTPSVVEAPVQDWTEAVPDLEREDVSADALPRNRWLELARELLARGEARLALRAFFLAELSHFAERGLIALARHKSNFDYRRELGRRGGANGELLKAYEESARLFDGVWYGEHPAGESEIERMETCLRHAGVMT